MHSAGSTMYVISCVSQKRDQPYSACDMYVSDLFSKARRYAEVSGYRWFIFSAEYGLVAPDQVIAPYERMLNRMGVAQRRSWSDQVAGQIVAQSRTCPGSSSWPASGIANS